MITYHQKLKKHRHLIFLAFVLIVGIYYLNNNREVFTILAQISWLCIVLTLLMRVFLIATNGAMLQLACNIFDVHLRFYEWFGLSVITTFANLFVPLSGGIIARAAYLKVRHGLTYTHFVSIFAATNVILLILTCLWGTFFFILTSRCRLSYIISAILMTLALAAAIMILLAPSLPITNSIIRYANDALEGFKRLSRKKSFVIGFFFSVQDRCC